MSRKLATVLSAILFTLLLVASGCAVNIPHGLEITAEQLKAFTPGSSTLEDVMKAFGKPGSTQRTSDGRTVIAYHFSRSRINAPSLSTLTGIAPRNELLGFQITLFTFDTGGKLLHYQGVVRDTDQVKDL